jgi:hypothetical protein
MNEDWTSAQTELGETIQVFGLSSDLIEGYRFVATEGHLLNQIMPSNTLSTVSCFEKHWIKSVLGQHQHTSVFNGSCE